MKLEIELQKISVLVPKYVLDYFSRLLGSLDYWDVGAKKFWGIDVSSRYASYESINRTFKLNNSTRAQHSGLIMTFYHPSSVYICVPLGLDGIKVVNWCIKNRVA